MVIGNNNLYQQSGVRVTYLSIKSLATSDKLSGISGWELNIPTLNRAAGGSN